MLEIKQKPVTLTREVLGFATNRIQYAILNEVWHLIENDVLTVADVDAVMTQGLGLRYAFLGPLETAHLNANGIADYVQRFGSEIWKVSQTYEPTPEMKDGKTLAKLSQQCEKIVPHEKLDERRAQRDAF
ncbi:Lambda-crystallin homolog [Eumeta japonica]|uniref:Lambda-crystallin homolog n=1 Tax=Eumeta variegata TaxID=151549 RepID=A0A4C1SFT0_EUMVA|nr:Lambda-crystallin homolog [Eumeta japonica]